MASLAQPRNYNSASIRSDDYPAKNRSSSSDSLILSWKKLRRREREPLANYFNVHHVRLYCAVLFAKEWLQLNFSSREWRGILNENGVLPWSSEVQKFDLSEQAYSVRRALYSRQ